MTSVSVSLFVFFLTLLACYYHNPQCVDENKQNVTDSCTEFIAYCENRYTPIYEPLPGMIYCYSSIE